VDDNCVGPLYKHVFPPQLAPSLSFLGIPWKVSTGIDLLLPYIRKTYLCISCYSPFDIRVFESIISPVLNLANR
jgi:hypothetical protein